MQRLKIQTKLMLEPREKMGSHPIDQWQKRSGRTIASCLEVQGFETSCCWYQEIEKEGGEGSCLSG